MNKMDDPRPPSRFRASPDIVDRRIDDEVVLVHLTTNRIYVLNRTAARLWDLLCAGHERAEILRLMLQEFDVTEAHLTNEIEDLLISMTRDQLITPYETS